MRIGNFSTNGGTDSGEETAGLEAKGSKFKVGFWGMGPFMPPEWQGEVGTLNQNVDGELCVPWNQQALMKIVDTQRKEGTFEEWG